VRLVIRAVSEACVTAGTVIVLFVVYVLFWTGVTAGSAMDGEVERLQERWSAAAASAPAATSAPAPSPKPSASDGEAFAVMYIPRFGRDWHKPVLEGTGEDTLKRGLGHYARTAGPGETGNFAVAGHRRTYGDPFKDFPELRPGDAVVIGDGTTWYTYRIDNRPLRTLPSDTGVIDPVPAPFDEDAAPYPGRGRYLTLTTCEPEWGHSHRLIAWAHLDATRPVGEGMPEALSGD
jgi:sortase A